MFKLFEIKEGKVSFIPDLNPNNVKKSIIASVILLLVVGLSFWLKIDEKDLWKFYNILIQQFGLKQQAPDINRKKELEARVELGVDKAIQDVTPEYDRIIAEADKKYKPVYQDLPNDDKLCYSTECKKLEPPMRICAPWIDNCIGNRYTKEDK